MELSVDAIRITTSREFYMKLILFVYLLVADTYER